MPPRIFIDTNVLISGLLFEGNEARILELALNGKVKLVISKQVIEEAKRALIEKFGLSAALSEVVVEGWSKVAEIVEVPKEEAKKFLEMLGEKDALVLAAAVNSNVGCLVTGDRSFHQRGVKKLIDVVTAKQFLEGLKV